MIPGALGLLVCATVWLASRTRATADPILSLRLASLQESIQPESSEGAGKESSMKRFLSFWGRLRQGSEGKFGRLLQEAGLEATDASAFSGAQFICLAVGMLIGLRAGVGAILASPLLGFAGYRAPEVYLSYRSRLRRDQVAAALPDAVDLLVVCTQAGLNLPLSLQRVAENTPGRLGKELRRAVEEIALGVPRSTALADLAARSGLDDMSSLVATLSNADRFGTGVAAALEGFAEDVRQSRRRRAEEQARRAPVKILFPMVFLILPAFLVLTVLPVVLGTMHSIGF